MDGARSTLAERHQQTGALSVFDILPESINELRQPYRCRQAALQSGKGQPFEPGDPITKEGGGHVGFAAGKMMIQAGFTETGCRREQAQGRTVVATGFEDIAEGFEQPFPGREAALCA